jgi:hypothetical protein
MTMFSMARAAKLPSARQRYSRATVIELAYGVTAEEICEAIRKAANTAGTLTSLRN